ncbi:hypothetical protein GCM10007071_07680 [Marinobacter zhanjiangensis]|uniref:Uncharacterized protein n=1 Tax=Marinobacter zhanjiangensis TaxID=578215 RepID=A0ABQ3ARM1_9GAMM|nr:hypothetical protein GCM10007071_07680 [Marinobacter zhanjiangensis]
MQTRVNPLRHKIDSLRLNVLNTAQTNHAVREAVNGTDIPGDSQNAALTKRFHLHVDDRYCAGVEQGRVTG